MARQAFLGTKIRRLRKQAGYTQAKLAELLEISPSYLNLLERNARALTVPLLLKLADVFKLDLKTFAEDDEGRLVADLKEALSDPLFAGRTFRDADLRELLGTSADVARALVELYRAYRRSRDDAQTMAARLSDEEKLFGLEASRVPSEEVSDAIQRHRNHYPELEEAAQALREEARLDGARGDPFNRLVRHVEERHGLHVDVVTSDALEGAVRRYVPAGRRLLLSEALPPASLTFQLAHQLALVVADDVLARLAAQEPLTTDESRRLYRVSLANYLAAATLMPYARFLESARSVRYDVELLEHRFRGSFEQVCHRLTTLHREGAEGVPFHLVRIDIAGNISKRFSGSGILFARYSGACPLWNVHAAFLTPGLIRTQLSEMPDGTRYFSIARTVRKAGGGHQVRQSRLAIELGCETKYGRDLVYADGVDLEAAAVPVGVSCRLCERMDCRQRAFPPMHHRLAVDENVRGLSFYYSPKA
jgi:predicted transcriptional regulator/DNA-binding XRE family transcriptional regulator